MNSTDFVIMVGFPFFSKAVILGIQNIIAFIKNGIQTICWNKNQLSSTN